MVWQEFGRPAGSFRHAAVGSSHPAASRIAAAVLHAGGNAVDAAVAASAALSVAQPMMCGIGGDVFALVWLARERTVVALNGSGRSPRSAAIVDLRDRGRSVMPETGPLTVTVPGAVAAWHDLAAGFGTIGLSDLLQHAIALAESGVTVGGMTGWSWRRSAPKLAAAGGDAAGSMFLPSGRGPDDGDVVTFPDLASSLRTIADDGPSVVYHGRLGASIARHVERLGGWLDSHDLACHRSEWPAPLSLEYRGYRVFQCPPNSQGIATLIALDIAERSVASSVEHMSSRWYELMIDAAETGLRITLDRLGDPDLADDITLRGNPVEPLGPIRRAPRDPGADGDTAYVAVVDAELNACSMISSLYHDFGSGVVVPGTGIVLNNRGALFSMDDASPDALDGGKRPYHTIMPGLVFREGELDTVLGAVGGFQQPQAQLQILSHRIDGRLDPQQAIDAPRFRVDLPTSSTVLLEDGVANDVAERLRRRGRQVRYVHGLERAMFGGAQVVSRDHRSGRLLGASDPRSDGATAGW
jgi:gamma-glutamyltranspeptidase/glutathione hydrolase